MLFMWTDDGMARVLHVVAAVNSQGKATVLPHYYGCSMQV